MDKHETKDCWRVPGDDEQLDKDGHINWATKERVRHAMLRSQCLFLCSYFPFSLVNMSVRIRILIRLLVFKSSGIWKVLFSYAKSSNAVSCASLPTIDFSMNFQQH
jgi:hypothetical protein